MWDGDGDGDGDRGVVEGRRELEVHGEGGYVDRWWRRLYTITDGGCMGMDSCQCEERDASQEICVPYCISLCRYYIPANKHDLRTGKDQQGRSQESGVRSQQ